MLARRFSLVLILCVAGCGPSTEEYGKVVSQLTDARDSLRQYVSLVEELRNTPHERLAQARKLQSEGDLASATTEMRTLIERYPDSQEASIARDALEIIQRQEREKRAAEERRQRLGLRALSKSTNPQVGPLRLKFNSVRAGGQWNFDRHGDEYYYRDAKRGETFILADVSISSKEHDPDLPPIYVYRAQGGNLAYVGTLRYEFYRWDDYASYLGNEADFGNDFAHTETIRFSAGLTVPQETATSEALFVLVGNEQCFNRSYKRFDNPPVSYFPSGCSERKTLTVDEASKHFHLVAILNESKL